MSPIQTGMSPRGHPLGDISKTATSLEARAPTQRPPAAGERSPHVSGGAAPGGEPSLEPICVVRPTWASARASIVSPLLPRLAHTVRPRLGGSTEVAGEWRPPLSSTPNQGRPADYACWRSSQSRSGGALSEWERGGRSSRAWRRVWTPVKAEAPQRDVAVEMSPSWGCRLRDVTVLTVTSPSRRGYPLGDISRCRREMSLSWQRCRCPE